MIESRPNLIQSIRDRFAHVERCHFTGPRVFLENAGGSLHLKSVVETSALHASLPDNQGRANAASQALMRSIAQGKADMALFFNANGGQVFVGESGTEVLFRLIRTAALGAQPNGVMLGSTLEHPASTSAMTHWAKQTDRVLMQVAHNTDSATVEVESYLRALTSDVRVATIVHTSPVSGMAVDVAAVAAAIRAKAPDAYIIVDGIQHASHGAVDVAALGVDGYAVSPYKMFSRHGYGVGWASDRLCALVKEQLIGTPHENWELGTRDSGAYATFSDVVAYLEWLGQQVSEPADRRSALAAAGRAIAAHERDLLTILLSGTGNLRGVCDMPGVDVIGGNSVEGREGVVSLRARTVPSPQLVDALEARGFRVHLRKNDHYCGNILRPLRWEDCIRVSVAHYNTRDEIKGFLSAMEDILTSDHP